MTLSHSTPSGAHRNADPWATAHGQLEGSNSSLEFDAAVPTVAERAQAGYSIKVADPHADAGAFARCECGAALDRFGRCPLAREAAARLVRRTRRTVRGRERS